MAMSWFGGQKTFDNLRREAFRTLENHEANGLSIDETNAYSQALHEIAWAIVNAQPFPTGYEISLSAECVAMFRAAADMAERERRENSLCFARLTPLPTPGAGTDAQVLQFPPAQPQARTDA